jgi:hypothetical protein
MFFVIFLYLFLTNNFLSMENENRNVGASLHNYISREIFFKKIPAGKRSKKRQDIQRKAIFYRLVNYFVNKRNEKLQYTIEYQKIDKKQLKFFFIPDTGLVINKKNEDYFKNFENLLYNFKLSNNSSELFNFLRIYFNSNNSGQKKIFFKNSYVKSYKLCFFLLTKDEILSMAYGHHIENEIRELYINNFASVRSGEYFGSICFAYIFYCFKYSNFFKNCDSICLDSLPEAIPFYKKLGFYNPFEDDDRYMKIEKKEIPLSLIRLKNRTKNKK